MMQTETSAWEQFEAADNMNRLRLGDAADELLQIQHMIEALPASEQQTAISERASQLQHRMKDNVGDDLASLLLNRGNYVAYMRYTDDDRIVSCDSDAKDAFKVYRQP